MDSGDPFTGLTLDALMPSSSLREESRHLRSEPASEKSRRRSAVGDDERDEGVSLESVATTHKIDNLA
jgi:hypothetical protein